MIEQPTPQMRDMEDEVILAIEEKLYYDYDKDFTSEPHRDRWIDIRFNNQPVEITIYFDDDTYYIENFETGDSEEIEAISDVIFYLKNTIAV